MTRRIAFISEHASPLGNLGGADGGGQNVYVAQLAKHLAALGYEVDVFTRRDRRDLPEVVNWIDRVRIIHVEAGPASFVRKEDMLPYMDEFRDWMLSFFRRQEAALRPDPRALLHVGPGRRGHQARDRHPVRDHVPRARQGAAAAPGRRRRLLRRAVSPSRTASCARPTRSSPSARRTRKT